MVYDWDSHEKLCFQLYINEKRSLEDIMVYLKLHHNFAPWSVLSLSLSTSAPPNVFVVPLASRTARSTPANFTPFHNGSGIGAEDGSGVR